MSFKVSEVQVSLGVAGVGAAVTIAKTDGDRKVAREVITFLEDRRVLFGIRHSEDEIHCVRSALEIRSFIGARIAEAAPGKDLEQMLREIRAAARGFVRGCWPRRGQLPERGSHFQVDSFSLALGELRTRVGAQLAQMSLIYDLEVEDDLRIACRVFDTEEPEQDLSWIPGFDR